MATNAANGAQSENQIRAEALKNEANKLFAEKHYEAAIKQYTEAIEADPTVPAFYTNRALAYIRTESFGLALSDADKAIELNPSFAKAYYRRATANMSMLKFKEAQRDLKTVVKLNPRDPDATQKLDECSKIVRRIEFEKAIAGDEVTKSPFDALGDIDAIVVEPSYDGPHIADSGIDREFVVKLMDHFKKEKKLHRKYAYKILKATTDLFRSYKSLVNVSVPENGRLTVCGDTHGQYYDLCHIFELNGLPSPTNAYLFNGDFVDRGSFSIEVIFTLLAWKLVHPDQFHLTRGNHETIDMNKMYGFEGECRAKFNVAAFNAFTELFNAIPIANVINDKIFVVHGGLPSQDNVTLDMIRQIDRFKQPAGNDLMTDLLWADPQPFMGRGRSKRGTGFQFGPDITEDFLSRNGLDLVIRSHEVKEAGYEIAHGGKCVTIFSAPNYCDAVGNLGAYIVITPDLKLKYEQFSAVPHPNIGPMKYSPLRGF
ncbi:Serine/threonine-protein phosphatase 5 [Allomyces javanicus]|nr:Serine/threonine-protein phosphatase 5 [Allomyces javanicus]